MHHLSVPCTHIKISSKLVAYRCNYSNLLFLGFAQKLPEKPPCILLRICEPGNMLAQQLCHWHVLLLHM